MRWQTKPRGFSEQMRAVSEIKHLDSQPMAEPRARVQSQLDHVKGEPLQEAANKINV
jgi:hypothetical protein